MKTLILSLLGIFLAGFCIPLSANDTIVISTNMYQVDDIKKLIVVNEDVTQINTSWPNQKVAILLDDYYNFQPAVEEVTVGTGFSVESNGEYYALYFTELPLISIHSSETIVDEPRVPASFFLSESNGNTLSSYIGIEFRGGFAQSFPKKSFRIEFWYDPNGNSTRNVSLLNMRNDDDWNLQSMYNEHLRFRSITNNELWQDIHPHVYYQDNEPDAVNGIRMEYAELFLNGEYHGIYAVGERIDRKQLELKDYNGAIHGELYKGKEWGSSVVFGECKLFDNNSDFWNGFLYKFPEESIQWNNLKDFVCFVVNEPDASFNREYPALFDINNAVDYFIFLNLLRATDNIGKNLFIARYDADEPYFYVPWDLDGTFGIIWSGEIVDKTDDVLSNGLYDRLFQDCSPGGFRELLKKRWNELREEIITRESLVNRFMENHTILMHNGVYEREKIAWSNYYYVPENLDYLSSWIQKRIDFLDGIFNEECVPVKTPDPKHLVFYPNPATDFIEIRNLVVQPAEVTIYDMNGKLIFRNGYENSRIKIDVSQFPQGLYVVQFQTYETTITNKLVINR